MQNDASIVSQENSLFLMSDPKLGRSLTRRDLLTILFKRKFVILSLWISVTVLVSAGLVFLPPTYVAEAKVLVKIEQQGRPSFLAGIAAYNEAPDTEPANRKLETEMEVMLARPLAEQVVSDLNLKPEDMYYPPYVHLLAPIGRLVDWIKTNLLGFSPKPSRAFETTVEALIDSLNVSPAKSKGGEATPNLITIRFKTSKDSVANEALSRLVFHYQHFSNELDQESGGRAYRIVEQRLNEAASNVTTAQEQLKEFARKAHSLGIEGEVSRGTIQDNAVLAAQPTANVRNSMQLNRVQKLEIDLAEQEQRFTDNVESVAVVKQSLAEARKSLAKKAVDSANYADQMLTLQRNMRMAEDHYLDLRRKLTQIGLFLNMNPNQVSNRVLVEPPLLPESSEWKKSIVYGIAASIAGLLLGLGVASLLEYEDHSLSNPEDVERFTGLPLLITIDVMDENRLGAFTGIDKAET